MDASTPRTDRPEPAYHVCFVCTGNICRSPLAESVFRAKLAEDGLADEVRVSSAGTGGWHTGSVADHRTVEVLEEAGYESAHSAQQFQAEWFDGLDLVIALDLGHERDLKKLAPTAADAAKVRLLRSYDPKSANSPEVADPYYGTRADFDTVLEQVEAAVPGLLRAVREDLAGRRAAAGTSPEPDRAPGGEPGADEDPEPGADERPGGADAGRMEAAR
ncbi:low molecular weight phosphotyrosine protein phosphatase [Streptomyces sp. XM4193]|uniref:low molecular weight protein-tyrosine-phosphatase n=1 Tax=Streptomyces sp. XM4193 TaxID=2929782 RepID=UPI001FF8C5E0|nr:low molecular weight protein-tyrosine-phosphatase [Streptomyces sp. XM4193]MCK1794660.1 low molecular weight phosphotyrosine protein phosphatase [Streptomyces sp. XM4193]